MLQIKEQYSANFLSIVEKNVRKAREKKVISNSLLDTNDLFGITAFSM